jgi:hypothetical protein
MGDAALDLGWGDVKSGWTTSGSKRRELGGSAVLATTSLFADVRFVIFAAIAIVVWAAFVAIRASVSPPNYMQFGATVVLALAVAIQRINGIQRWLSSPKNKRTDSVDTIAQQTLINLCRDRPVTNELTHLCVHVWEVPLWYRKVFPYQLRLAFKRLIRVKHLGFLARYAFRPALRRVVAVGLVKPPPTGVRFSKGVGLIGVCIANNDPTGFVTLRTSSMQYREALKAKSESDWQNHGAPVTHNLELQDALKLARSYGQVIARVIQEPQTGEAIGCVTISVREANPNSFRINSAEVKQHALNLALTVAPILA